MASRTNIYDVEQILFSMQRYRSEHYFDKDSFKEQFSKHFNPELWDSVGEKVFERREVQQTLKENRQMLEERGKLPKFEYSNQELKQVKKITSWEMGTIKGRHVRVKEVTIKIKNKEFVRFRDSFGRFARRILNE